MSDNEANKPEAGTEIAGRLKPLVGRLRNEADLCRAETANDIATLLDEAADEVEKLGAALSRFVALDLENDSCGEWTELKSAWLHARSILTPNARLERLAENEDEETPT